MERIYLSPPHMDGVELDLLREAFDSNWIAPLGPQVDAFEEEFAQAVDMPHAVALSSGTAALHLGLILSGVEAGDEVLCSTLTFAASANAITYLGATPVFVDSDRQSWNMDPDLLAEDLADRAQSGRLPGAVLVVDLYGQSADYERIMPICDEFGVAVVEDAAEALGAEYRDRPVGGFGTCAAFSFNGNKVITTSGGGMLVSGDEKFADRARFLSTQARDPGPHHEHSVIGYNYRLSNLLAAVGRGQLLQLSDRVEARRRNFDTYVELLSHLPGIGFMPEAHYGRSSRWLSCITLDPEHFGATRGEVRLELEANNIEARPLWMPMHMQPVFKGLPVVGGSVAEGLFERGLCLPSGSSLTHQQLGRIASIVAGCQRS